MLSRLRDLNKPNILSIAVVKKKILANKENGPNLHRRALKEGTSRDPYLHNKAELKP